MKTPQVQMHWTFWAVVWLYLEHFSVGPIGRTIFWCALTFWFFCVFASRWTEKNL
jgi:hypothetical protein